MSTNPTTDTKTPTPRTESLEFFAEWDSESKSGQVVLSSDCAEIERDLITANTALREAERAAAVLCDGIAGLIHTCGHHPHLACAACKLVPLLTTPIGVGWRSPEDFQKVLDERKEIVERIAAENSELRQKVTNLQAQNLRYVKHVGGENKELAAKNAELSREVATLRTELENAR